MGDIVSLQANSKTHERKRLEREQTRQRLIQRIGINPADAPLFEEELRFLAYEQSIINSTRI